MNEQEKAEKQEWENECYSQRLRDQEINNDYTEERERCSRCRDYLNSHDHCPRCDY